MIEFLGWVVVVTLGLATTGFVIWACYLLIPDAIEEVRITRRERREEKERERE
jgi:hypothetical protein